MARLDEIDRLLWLWAETLKVGDGSGYPTKAVLHPDWSPPSPGITPTLKVSSRRRDAVGPLVGRLPDSLKATLAAKYLLRMSDREAAAALDCAVATVGQRVTRAQQLLARWLEDQGEVFATTS